jgi:hypothetical protein
MTYSRPATFDPEFYWPDELPEPESPEPESESLTPENRNPSLS